jgi:hypothetical protein
MNEKKTITETELFEEYIEGGWYEGVTFADYTQAHVEQGVTVIFE